MNKWTNCNPKCEHCKVWFEEKQIDGIITGISYIQCTANKHHKISEYEECPYYSGDKNE